MISSQLVERLLYLTLLVVFIVVGVSVVVFESQIQTQNKLVKSIENQAILTREHTDCVALLLTKPNRGDLRIQDLENCKIGP